MKRKNIKRSSFGIILGICFVGLLILTACSGSDTPEPAPGIETREVQVNELPSTQAPTETDQATDIATEEVPPDPTFDQTESDTTPEEGYPSPGDQLSGYPVPGEGYPPPDSQTGGYPSPGEGQPPPVKTALEATNPSTVSLASGDIQLVEFFAFW